MTAPAGRPRGLPVRFDTIVSAPRLRQRDDVALGAAGDLV